MVKSRQTTLCGELIARLVPVRTGGRQLGTLSGLVEIHDDLIASDLDDDFSDTAAPPSLGFVDKVATPNEAAARRA
jgi:hypothetical protein